MQLPVDVSAVMDQARTIEEERATPIALGVYLDESAPDDLASFARELFANPPANVELHVACFGRVAVPVRGDHDVAVVVAGLSDTVGAMAGDLRAAGVPAMVVSTLPALACQIASAAGRPLPVLDVVAPVAAQAPGALRSVASAASAAAGAVAQALDGIPGVPGPASGALRGVANVTGAASAPEASADDLFDEAAEPYALQGQARELLSLRMGQWLVQACPQKSLALALAFPCARRPLALEAVGSAAMQNAGIGVLDVIPGADMPLMTLNQVRMTLAIAAAYGEPMTIERVREVIAIVGAGFAFRTVAREVGGLIPVAGFAVRGTIGYTGTVAMGRAVIEYFESGRSVAGIAQAAAQGAGRAVHAAGGALAKAGANPIVQRARTGLSAGARTMARGAQGAAGGAARAARSLADSARARMRGRG
ncbi:hypothetical protein HLV37_01830 [Eggerthellaceae bacterium zg-1084]|uniref:hypothetical protein n=1 Tax=Berryella wangjianweii TaxID=2734634 RepID=UPI001553A422|nr:hypothetical protein [Berryella wangjianweii]NPD30621.1 hypothetical protein [Berryella wangjianweii]